MTHTCSEVHVFEPPASMGSIGGVLKGAPCSVVSFTLHKTNDTHFGIRHSHRHPMTSLSGTSAPDLLPCCSRFCKSIDTCGRLGAYSKHQSVHFECRSDKIFLKR